MRQGKVVVFHKPGVPLEIRSEPCPDPAPNEALVRVEMAGVCGSDAHRLSGDINVQSQPVCFGHEGVGVVEALGERMTSDRGGAPLAVGDRVYWAPSTPCGTCEACRASNPMFCKDLNWPVPAGGPNAAAFRDLATLNERMIMYRIPEGTSSAAVITFGCAMPTALRGFQKLGPLGDNVIIQGAGPVGLASTLLASLAGARNIIVIGAPDNRLDVARKLGATHTISVTATTVPERRELIAKLTEGRRATTVVEAAGRPEAFPEGFDLLGMNGQYLILGLYSGQAVAPIDPVRINNFNLKIIGSLGIDPETYLRTIEIATEHGTRLRFEDLITHRFPLQDIEKAIGTVAQGDSVKTVVVPEIAT
ncbi:MAG: hypothetical protein M1818_003022 [Claussenomyces sp. TS43310]|nr:MAG: hypothetical protein M1818_003022 [Claussenomyces sp. TS43310]